MHKHDTTEAVLRTLLDPGADVIDSAGQLGLTLAEFLEIAESPPVLQAIEALERIAQIRTRGILARSAHLAIATLERLAATDAETPAARETVRKAAAQILRMHEKGNAADVPLRDTEEVAEPSDGRREPASPHQPSPATPHRNDARRSTPAHHAGPGAAHPTAVPPANPAAA